VPVWWEDSSASMMILFTFSINDLRDNVQGGVLGHHSIENVVQKIEFLQW
jgi:hypothetical protein